MITQSSRYFQEVTLAEYLSQFMKILVELVLKFGLLCFLQLSEYNDECRVKETKGKIISTQIVGLPTMQC